MKFSDRPKTACIEGSGQLSSRGHYIVYKNGRNQYAHRYVYEQKHGYVSLSEVVHHLCRNKKCINVDHLIKIDRAEHSHLHNKGEENINVKVTEKQVLEIRAIYAEGNISYSKLAAKFNLTKSGVHMIINRRSWRHI